MSCKLTYLKIYVILLKLRTFTLFKVNFLPKNDFAMKL